MGAATGLTWPSGHGGWFFSEPSEYEANSATFLAEGVRRGEQVWFIAEEPAASRWPEGLLGSRVLVLGGIEEVYGPYRDGDLERQRSVFAAAVEAARRDGFTGIRVVADNTCLIEESPERWMQWESVVEGFIADSPVTGLCAFDRSRLSLDEVHGLLLVHPQAVGY